MDRESGLFGESLDKINWLIYNAINLNLDSFSIKIDPKNIEQYRKYFSNEFKNEYENTSFRFHIIEGSSSNEFTIQIDKH